MTLTSEQFNQLICNYAEQIVDGMDHKTIYQFAYDTIVANMEEMNDEDLINEMFNFLDEDEVKQMIEEVGANPEEVLK
jgi:hypothetical protein